MIISHMKIGFLSYFPLSVPLGLKGRFDALLDITSVLRKIGAKILPKKLPSIVLVLTGRFLHISTQYFHLASYPYHLQTLGSIQRQVCMY